MAKGRKSRKRPKFFQVEVILAARVADDTEDPGWEYLVKWDGYDDDADSWEPACNLQEGCEKLLASFWKDIGFDHKKYPVGHTFEASKSWIEKERKRFLLEKELEEKKSKDRRKGKGKGKNKEKIKIKKEESEDEMGEEIQGSKKRKRLPSCEKSESSARNSRERIQSKERSPVDTSSDDDDIPLQQSSRNLQQKVMKHKMVISSDEESGSNADLRQKKIQKVESSLKASDIVKDASTPRSTSPQLSSPEVTLQTKIQRKATPIEAHPSKHARRVTNPQAKIATLSASDIPSSSGGISTKHRLGQGALAPTLPKNVVPIIQQKSHPQPIRPSGSSLMNLNFKKNTIPTPVLGLRTPLTNEPTLASLNSPTAESPQMLTDTFPSVSRQHTSSNIVEGPTHSQAEHSFRQPDSVSPALISPPPLSAADAFLQSVMPPSLAGPLLPTPLEESSGPVPPKPLYAKKLPLPLPKRIQKLWKWSGPFYLDSNEEPLCNVQIHKASKDLTGTLKLSHCFDNIKTIRANRLYNNADFSFNLGVFRVPPQLAVFGPEEDKDTKSFSVFADYLEKAKKVFLMPFELDSNVVGYVLFFPYAHRMKVMGMDVPLDFNQPSSLVAALIPFALSQDQIARISSFPLIPPPSKEKVDNESLELRRKLQVLGFPMPLFNYIQAGGSKRSVAIFADRSLERRIEAERFDPDTENLVAILHRAGAPLVPYNAEARMVFIHVRALGYLHRFPRFAERRAASTVQFYIYGTHPDLSPSVGPVQEVYPCGGIVTFSPFAMRRNPLGVQELIRKINSHPLWESYILPSSLGLLAKLECGMNDPMVDFDKRQLMMDIILEQISEGNVALIQAPAEYLKDTQATNTDAFKDWISAFFLFENPKKRDALATGIRAFLANQKLSRSELSKSKALINLEIASDMNRMQRQRVFMSKYRRYVVIDIDPPDTPGPGPNDYGLEWSSLSKFDFKDDFYPKQ